MAATHPSAPTHREQGSPRQVSLSSAALLFISIVSIALVLIGVAVRGSTPLALVPAVLVGCLAILTLRK